jgi:hypothetical protein
MQTEPFKNLEEACDVITNEWIDDDDFLWSSIGYQDHSIVLKITLSANTPQEKIDCIYAKYNHRFKPSDLPYWSIKPK